MSFDRQDLLARQMNLLKRLEGRGVKRGSDLAAPGGRHPQHETDTPTPHSRTETRGGRAFDRLFPSAEALTGREGGVCRRIRIEVPPDGRATRAGYVCPAAAWAGIPRPADLARLTGDPRWAELEPERILYLDTETTQLSTAAGAYAFLVGLGRFAGGTFVLDQYFMEDHGCEPALVEHLDAALAEARALVSYNGRCFDLPLLETRWRMQRRAPRFPELHLDLLHTARRLWRLRLPGCGLGDVERHILGIRRLSDIDGALIPRIYLDFVRGVRPERIVPVFDHHAQDVISLGALASAVTHAVRRPDDPRFAHAGDQWGLARLLERLGEARRAIDCLEAAVLAARDEAFGYRLAMHLARAYKRCGRVADAVAIWEARAAQCQPGRLEALVCLAMHAEHALKDHAAALRYAERALAVARQGAELAWIGTAATAPRAEKRYEQELDGLRRRIERIERKIEETR
ncbi:MAG TPA: ribonuclease H-like domain-containing protein [Candidatus Sumerlaeota bacterium]|nr:ribonuclease H-like domain-containing protein [Candidatus Sumerlaeota bacterium]